VSDPPPQFRRGLVGWYRTRSGRGARAAALTRRSRL